ncbi:MAG TPA: adenylate/guanylate cyclase domain-containing protein [Alphaproteobacteria bacterium]|nr:adenylate/guanylate cyclase domain-containing protein [Alphaproteobacteria bacterium]
MNAAETGNPAPEASARLVREGLDALRFGFAVFDRDLRLVACNQAFGSLRDYPADLCRPGTNIAELYRFNAERGDYGPGDSTKQAATRLARARWRKPRELEYELSTGRILDIRYAPLANKGLLVSYADVTERKHAELALKESEERYSLAMAGADEGMWDWVAESDEVVISDSYKQLCGLRISGDRIALSEWVSMIHPDDRPIREQARQAHLEGRTNLYECEYRVRCGDGEYRWFRDRAKSRRDNQGRIVRMAGSLNDVTRRKQAELALFEANRRIREQNEQLASLSSQLSKYVSPQLYESIFSGKQSVELVSKRRKLSIFFADIVDFTEIAESLESEELTNLLNHYLTEMSQIAFKYGATIDKYIGDAIVAFFGDPESLGAKGDALACVQMAIAMQERMRELQRVWHDQGIERPFKMRVGINTGFCTVGNFGSQDRMDYTIIGNEVNLAARLQSSAPPGGILVAQETFSLVKDEFAFEQTDPITAKGLSRPVPCYCVIGRLDELKAAGRIIREYDDGVRIFLDLFRADKTKVARIIKGILGDLNQR